MAKIDHEKKNREDKAKRMEGPLYISGVADQRTFQGKPKQTYWALINQERSLRTKAEVRRKQKRKGKKQCPHCKQWILKHALERHIASIHEEAKCPICGDLIVGRNRLRKHIASHGSEITDEINELTKLPKKIKKKNRRKKTRIGEEFTSCPKCFKFINAAHLEKHLAWHDLALKCPECGRRFIKSSQLVDHISQAHGRLALISWTKKIQRMR